MLSDQNLALSLTYSVLLILGFIECGKLFLSVLKISSGFSWKYPGQQLVLGTATISILVSWGSVLVPDPEFYHYATGIIIVIGLVGGGHTLYEAFRANGFASQFRMRIGWVTGCMLSLMVLYGLANISLVSNADSLDYHLGYAYNYLQDSFESFPEWYTGRMAQAGEKVIALGLVVQAQAFSGLIQYAGLASLTILIANMPRLTCAVDSESDQNSNGLLALAWVSSPVLLFLATSAKPQLMPTAMSGLAFVLVTSTFSDGLQSGGCKTTRAGILRLLLAVGLAAVAATHKPSFLISLALLGSLCTYLSYRMGSMGRFLVWAGVIASLIFFPVYWDKYLRYQTSPMAFFASPAGGFDDSLSLFLAWVRAYRENPLPFPLYLVLPSSLGNFTTVLGFGVLLVVYGLIQCLRLKRTKFPIFPLIVLLGLFVATLWLVGQPSSRFYVEPYVWSLLLLSMLGVKFAPPWLKRMFQVASVGQTILVIGALSFYVLAVLASFMPGGQSTFLKKFVNGYDLHQWIDRQLPENAAVLLDHRSKALSQRIMVSTDPIEFMGQDEIGLQQLEKSLIKHRVQFAVTRYDSPVYQRLAECSVQTVAGPETMHLSSRNPFNAGGSYQAYIFLIEPTSLIRCISQRKDSS